jgi:hypothetical protein
MPHLPTTLWGFITVGGGVSALVAGFVYIIKKAVDIAADVVKARLLKQHAKDFIVLYGPDGKVVRRIEVDSR